MSISGFTKNVCRLGAFFQMCWYISAGSLETSQNKGQRRFRRAHDGDSISGGVLSVTKVPNRVNSLAVGRPVFAGAVWQFYRLRAQNLYEGRRAVCHRYGIHWPLRHGSEKRGNLCRNSSTCRHCLCAHATRGVFWIHQWAWRLSLCWSGNTEAVWSVSLLLSIGCWLKFLTMYFSCKTGYPKWVKSPHMYATLFELWIVCWFPSIQTSSG